LGASDNELFASGAMGIFVVYDDEAIVRRQVNVYFDIGISLPAEHHRCERIFRGIVRSASMGDYFDWPITTCQTCGDHAYAPANKRVFHIRFPTEPQ